MSWLADKTHVGAAALALCVLCHPLAACRPPATVPDVQHLHTDHLGSVQAVTDKDGLLIRQVRYESYGGLRGRFDGQGAAAGASESYRHEFTGHASDIESGLVYAGARYYDPETAQFLSHDPKRQYASPYQYGPNDPMNGTDPDGKFFDPVTIGVFLAVAGAVAAGVDAYRATGDWGRAFKAAGMSLGMSAVTFGVFRGGGLIVKSAAPTVAKSAVAAKAFKMGMMGYGVHGAVQSSRNGSYASALVGAAGVGFSAYGLAKGAAEQDTSQIVSGDTDPQADFVRRATPHLAGGEADAQFAVETYGDKIAWEKVRFSSSLLARVGGTHVRGSTIDTTGPIIRGTLIHELSHVKDFQSGHFSLSDALKMVFVNNVVMRSVAWPFVHSVVYNPYYETLNLSTLGSEERATLIEYMFIGHEPDPGLHEQFRNH